MMKLRAILLCLVAVCRLDAGTGVGTSPSNATVDTTNWFGTLSVTMHRATAAVLENSGETAGIDEALRVRATNRALLGSQPALPEWNALLPSGLIADGVTPLLFRIARTDTPSAAAQYEVVLATDGSGSGSLTSSPQGLLLVAGSYACTARTFLTLSASQPDGYVVVQPVQPEALQPNALGEVRLRLEVRDAVTGAVKKSFKFALRRPPIALVHGYNTNASGWGPAFLNAVDDGRAAGFILRVGYGTENGNQANTYDSLLPLAATLSKELRDQVEKAAVLSRWAWTRYDAVGHSQGGVLLRMLSSRKELTSGDIASLGFPAFRTADNHYRGRFRRVVTIGSPHAGSTLGEMGIQLRNLGVPFQLRIEVAGDHELHPALEETASKLLQPKFQIGSGSQLDIINHLLVCDPAARLHMLQTTIYNGNAPGSDGESGNPHFYRLLYLNAAGPTVNGQRPGLVAAPIGADGVADAESQTAGSSGTFTSAITGEDIGHAAIPYLPNDVPQTGSPSVGQKVRDLLNGSVSAFSPVAVPSTFEASRNLQRTNIAALAQAIQAAQRKEQAALYTGGGGGASALPSGKSNRPLAPGDQVLNFTLQAPPGESPAGLAEWDAAVYGPAGMTSAGLTLAVAGTYGEQLTLTVAAAVTGEVVLGVRFPSITGQTVIGTPQVVLTRPPGSVLTGISLVPPMIQTRQGAVVPLEVWGIYDGSMASRLFVRAANTGFQSSNTAVATVDAAGTVQLLGPGTATITTMHNGTLTATTAVTVLDAVPAITSSANVSGTVGTALSHQLTASQTVQTFVAETLPPGLTLNTQTGLIAGTPTTEGATAVIVSATNANGTGSRQVQFVIAGAPGAPTDVGLDASGVSEQKPAGTLVGRLVSVDPNPLDTFSYQLETGTGSTDNYRFSIAGGQLFTAQVLSRATTPTVSIRVRTTDSSGGSYAKVLVLPVVAPPAITRQPDARVVFAGESATFFVETTGLDPLQYQWRKGGVDVPGATSRIFELPATALADAGSYTVTVVNGDGSATSTAASLVVNPISYGRWASALPATLATALFEPTADYDGDGIVNFLDFAFGVSPGIESGRAAQPFVTRDASGPVLVYREANGVELLAYRILKSVNLGAWVEHVPTAGEVTRTNLGSFTEVQVRVPGANSAVFFKIQVVLP